MTNLRPVPRDQEAEAPFWPGVAKRVLGGEISLDEALRIQKFGTPCAEASDLTNDPQP